MVYNDGGRVDAGFKGTTGDCVCRAIAIAIQFPCAEVCAAINQFAKRERIGKRKREVSSSGTAVYEQTQRKYMESI